MRSRRLELPRGFPHKHLKLARLPFRHDRIVGRGRGIADDARMPSIDPNARYAGRAGMADRGLTALPRRAGARCEARVAAIRAGTRGGAGLAGGAPAALHRRHLGPRRGPAGPRPLPHFRGRARRAVDLSRPRPARRLCDARPHPAARQVPGARCAQLRPRAGGMADPRARPLRRAGRTARGPRRHLGRRAGRDRGQDRRHRRARVALGELARRGAERRARPGHFAGIVPCGIREHGVTSLQALGVPATMAEADEALGAPGARCSAERFSGIRLATGLSCR